MRRDSIFHSLSRLALSPQRSAPVRVTHGKLRSSLAVVALGAVTLSLSAGAEVATPGDVTVVALWDGETSDPSGPLLNRFGGNPVQGIRATVAHTTAGTRTGAGAFRLDTNQPIPAGGFDFVAISFTGFGPTAAYVDTRALTPFERLEFWLRNETGAPFSLVVELKDYRDSNSHRARRSYAVSSSNSWTRIEAPLDLSAPGWAITGSPDLSRAKLIALVIEANQGSAVAGSMFIDDMALGEPGGPLDPATADRDQLLAHLARRQFLGIWGSRDRTTGMVPTISSFADVCTMNVLAALVQLLPGAAGRGWVSRAETDAYVGLVVQTLNGLMDEAVHLPPRYVDRVRLEPTLVAEESSIDAALLFLALYRYQKDPATPTLLAGSIGTLLQRFDFAAFSSPTGWKLAYLYDPGTFTPGTYDGYSGEPWLISLAAHLSVDHHVNIETHYHSSVFRVREHLEDPARAHLVHTLTQFRAPFLQWLLPLLVDVTERGADTYPDPQLASNPYHNAVAYQREVHARAAALGRGTFLQPDAGDDGSGAVYEQFSFYEDFGQPGLFMPWSSAFSFLAEPAVGEAALRELLAHDLHGPLGLTDSVIWPTGEPAPDRVTARHDFWNLSLSTLAMVQFLYGENLFLAGLPEVRGALDRVFFQFRDGFESGGMGAWSLVEP